MVLTHSRKSLASPATDSRDLQADLKMTTLSLGSAMADITPNWPLTLAGFAARTEPSRGVSQPLRARVSVLESDQVGVRRRVVVVAADLLWWGQQDASSLRTEIATIAETSPDYVLLSATHTHSAPQTAIRASREIGVVAPDYTTLLRERVVSATARAMAALEPVTLRRFTGTCEIGFNRRYARNPAGPTDPCLTVLCFDRTDGTPAALWVHFACHPVITQEPLVSAEFCGVAMDRLETHLGVTASFLQGCCGDINPVAASGRESLRGGDAEVVATGDRLASEVERLLASDGGEPISDISLSARLLTVELPFAAIPTDETLRHQALAEGVEGELARALLAHPEWNTPSIPLELQRLDLGPSCRLLAMNGEIVADYGLRIRELSQGAVLPLGYANGMTGYIPTSRILVEGGYEAGEAAPYFLLPGPFAPEVEPLMDEAIASILAS